MAKSNDKILCYLKKAWILTRFFLLIAGMLITAALAYARIDGRVKANTKACVKSDANELAITEMKTDLKYIKDGIDNVIKKLDAKK